jgi:hypothetical protein
MRGLRFKVVQSTPGVLVEVMVAMGINIAVLTQPAAAPVAGATAVGGMALVMAATSEHASPVNATETSVATFLAMVGEDVGAGSVVAAAAAELVAAAVVVVGWPLTVAATLEHTCPVDAEAASRSSPATSLAMVGLLVGEVVVAPAGAAAAAAAVAVEHTLPLAWITDSAAPTSESGTSGTSAAASISALVGVGTAMSRLKIASPAATASSIATLSTCGLVDQRSPESERVMSSG